MDRRPCFASFPMQTQACSSQDGLPQARKLVGFARLLEVWHSSPSGHMGSGTHFSKIRGKAQVVLYLLPSTFLKICAPVGTVGG